MRLAYLPGAGFPSKEIALDKSAVFRYTARGNLVGVITNGTAVPGLGNVGPEAAKPMQEGMSVLFKRLADIDVFDLELNTVDPDKFIETVKLLEPTFGGVNLKDIRAPEGLYIYDRLSRDLNIPCVPRKPVQHRRGGHRRPHQCPGTGREAGGLDPGGHLRRGNGRNGLRPPSALPGRSSGKPPRL